MRPTAQTHADCVSGSFSSQSPHDCPAIIQGRNDHQQHRHWCHRQRTSWPFTATGRFSSLLRGSFPHDSWWICRINTYDRQSHRNGTRVHFCLMNQPRHSISLYKIRSSSCYASYSKNIIFLTYLSAMIYASSEHYVTVLWWWDTEIWSKWAIPSQWWMTQKRGIYTTTESGQHLR